MKKHLPALMTIALTISAAAPGSAADANMDDLLTSAGRAAWTIKNLGPQITRTTVMSCAVDPGDNNTSGTAYYALMGEPGQLAAVDMATGKLIRSVPLTDAQGSYFMTMGSDHNLYIATQPKGFLLRYKPGADKVENMGKPADHVSFIWDIVEGPAGKIYGACYPKSTIFEYDMATQKMRDLGPAKEGEDYARSLAWDSSRQRLYVGIGSHADVVEINPATGERRSILPEQFADAQFAYALGAVDGQIIARLSPGETAVVIDAESGTEITTVTAFTGNTVSDHGPDGEVYFSGNGQLIRYDPAAKSGEDTGYELKGEIRGFAWGVTTDGKTSELLMATTGKNYHRYDPAKRRGERTYCELPELPLHLQNIIAGPDDKIYSSGYVSGQLGILYPATGDHQQYGNVKQAEGMTFYNKKLFLGTYPGANLSVFDISKPPGENNPDTLFNLKDQGQDRPFGMLGVPEIGKVFMGTVPGYGLLGGAFAVIDPENPEPKVMRNLIKDQGIVTFAYKDGILYGGTTIHGGLGIEPSAKEGRLFLWDVKEQKLILSLVPVTGKEGVSGLRFGSDGKLRGWAEGAVFVFNPETKIVEYSEDKFFPKEPPRHFWRGTSMTNEVDGKFYGCGYGQVFSLDAKTNEMQVLASGGMEIVTRDSAGKLYVIRNEDLLQLTPKK